MDEAKPGDLVLFVAKDYKRFTVQLEPGEQLHTHRGMINHDDIIGRPLGRQVLSHMGRPFLVLEPSTHDLIRDIRRTTQIVFPQDASYMLMRLNIHPGVRVIEAGTGSGAFSLALARSVMPAGRVYSYDMREDMLNLARRNLDKVGLLPYVDLKLRDIEAGFDETGVDALFLDVRTPWSYLQQAWTALKGGGFLGVLVPTTNQVVELLRHLPEHGFGYLEVEEMMLRPYKAVAGRFRPMDRMVSHTGYLIFARRIEPDAILVGEEAEPAADACDVESESD
jgi:tRNA (adenine57-N1/adenine58-N1)-methyltransferase catalytic subunit